MPSSGMDSEGVPKGQGNKRALASGPTGWTRDRGVCFVRLPTVPLQHLLTVSS